MVCLSKFIINCIVFFFQTSFSPHRTVLKVFVVLYDFTGMSNNSHTFIWQKTVSVKRDSENEVSFLNACAQAATFSFLHVYFYFIGCTLLMSSKKFNAIFAFLLYG